MNFNEKKLAFLSILEETQKMKEDFFSTKEGRLKNITLTTINHLQNLIRQQLGNIEEKQGNQDTAIQVID